MSTIPDLTPEGLAFSGLMEDGTWRDPEGRNLCQVVMTELGDVEGARVWREACDLFEGRQVQRAAQRPVLRGIRGGAA